VPIADITAAMIGAWMTEQQSAGERLHSRVAHRATLSSVLQWAVDSGLPPDGPVHVVRAPARTPLRRSERCSGLGTNGARAWAVAAAAPRPRRRAGHAAAARVAIDTGLRWGERTDLRAGMSFPAPRCTWRSRHSSWAAAVEDEVILVATAGGMDMTFGSTCSGPSACTCSPEPPTTDGSSSVRCDDGPSFAAAPPHEGCGGADLRPPSAASSRWRTAPAPPAETPGRVGRVTADLPLLGFGLPVSGDWARPETMRHVARRAEALGYASLWTFQRVLVPADTERDPAYGAEHDPSLRAVQDPAYRAVHDPVVPLAYVAGITERIGLGTGTICAPFTAPALLAKTLTSLDVLSGGRLTAGVGMGWMPQEYAAAGVPFERRGARMDEYLRCLQALWTQDPVEFAGEFYTVPRAHVAPSPVQRPHPPVLLGGAAVPALRRAGRLAQGWIGSSRQDLTRIGASVATVREGAREGGRDPDAVRIVVRGLVDLVDDDPGRSRRPLHGTREQVLDDLVGLRAKGVTEVFLDLNFTAGLTSPDVDARGVLDEAERVLDAFAPAHPAG
jgi:probable F420-dependent oxidoreductase